MVARSDRTVRAAHVCAVLPIHGGRSTAIFSIQSLAHSHPSAGPAFLTTVKVWAYGFVFSAAGLLVLLRLPPPTLRRMVLGLGVGTYVIMVLLWFVVPASACQTDAGVGCCRAAAACGSCWASRSTATAMRVSAVVVA